MKRRRQPRTNLVVKIFPSVPHGVWMGKGITRWLARKVFYREFQVSFTKVVILAILAGGLSGWAVAAFLLNYQSLTLARAYKAEAASVEKELRLVQRDYVSLFGRIQPIERRLARMDELSDDISTVLGVSFGDLDKGASKEEVLEARRKAEELQARFEHLGSYLADQREQLAHTPSISPIKAKFWLTSRFGPRVNPFTAHGGPEGGGLHFHSALDLACEEGTPIYATADAVVEFAGHIPAKQDVFRSRYGNYVILNHQIGFRTIYAHCKELNVEKGQKVKRGDVIAWVGSTGRSTGPHLHYEVLLEDRAVDPSYYILDLDRDIRRAGAAVRPTFDHESELYEAHKRAGG